MSLETGAVRSRHGIADMLGARELSHRSQDGQPVSVFEDALSWLRGGGDGIFIVDWTRIHVPLK